MVPEIRRAALAGLIVLTGLNLFNYVDRQVLPAVGERLRSDLLLQDWQTGLLGTGFVAVFILASPLFGLLGDAHSRTRLIAAAGLLWSLATAGSGLATTFALLFLARALVGVGEAAYGTIAPSLLSDYCPRTHRARMFAYFYAAIPVGSALGYLVGGLVGHELGWRGAFLVVGLPGVILSLLALRLYDPPRGSSDGVPVQVQGGVLAWSSYRELLRNRLYLLTVAGYTAGTFAVGALAFWMPTFLTRVRHMSATEAPVAFGLLVAAAGLVGSLAGGWLGDAGLRYSRQAYLWLCGACSLLAVPFVVLALKSPSPPIYLSAIFLASLFVFVGTGPVNATLVNVVPAGRRSSAIAAATSVIHLLGDGPSPYLVGLLSGTLGLENALLLVPGAFVVGGLIWLYAAWSSPESPPFRPPPGGIPEVP